MKLNHNINLFSLTWKIEAWRGKGEALLVGRGAVLLGRSAIPRGRVQAVFPITMHDSILLFL